MRSRRTFVRSLLVIVFLGSWIPFPSVVVPQWRVQIVDINGAACAKQTVNQSWADYSLSDHSNGDYQKTDAVGFVEFPERRISKNLIQRIIYPIIAYALLLAHGSVGIHAYVGASEPVNAGVFGLKYERNEPLPEKLIIKRCFVDNDIPDKSV